MDNQQAPKADSKFQKIARANHRKWKIRLLAGGGQKADSGGGPYKEKPDYNRAKSAPPGFGGSLEEEQLDEVIRKKDGKYCSQECYKKTRTPRRLLVCETCGKEFSNKAGLNAHKTFKHKETK
jgi:hypothetical protein